MSNKKKILLVEDDVLIAVSQKQQLETYNYEIKTVTSGEKAISYIEEQRDIDLILMDINLGKGLDGTETAEIILNDHDIPILFLSSHSDKETVEKTEKITSYGYVVKGCNMTILDASIKMAFKLFDALQKKKKHEEDLKDTLEATTDGIWSWDFTTNILNFSPKYYTMLGYKPDEFPANFDSWKSLIHPDDLEGALAVATEYLKAKPDSYENRFRMKTKSGEYKWISARARVVKRDEKGNAEYMIGNHEDITEQKIYQESLENIKWLLESPAPLDEDYKPHYGDVTSLNHDGIIKKYVDHHTLALIVNDFMHLVGTSCAIYEKNGDYAFGIFSSGWCRTMDSASFELCETENLEEALNCGKWLCHESCWTDASKISISKAQAIEIQCNGGINIYTIPIIVDGEPIGSINFGYGDPPGDTESITELAEKYQVEPNDLIKNSSEYLTRPEFIINYAKKRLESAAEQIAHIVKMKKTEEALLKSEDLLNKTGEMAKVGAWEIDLNTNSVYWSHGTKLIHEVPPDFETNLENAVDYYLGEAQEVITRAVNDAIEYGKIFDLELDFKTAKGNYRCVRAIGYSDFSESICTRVYGTFMDITSQKQAEQKLVESEAMFKNFFELATVGNIQGSPDGKILRVNKKFCEITGYTADELFKKTVLEITHPEDLSLDQGYINRVISGEIDSYTIEKRYIHKNGKVVWVELYSNVHRDETGEVIYAIGSIVDITDRKKSQEDLHKAKTFLENTIKQSPFAMWISDKNGNIIKTNPALCKFINLTNEQIIGKYNVLKDENLKKQGVMEKVKNVFHKKASASFSIPWKAMDAGTDEMSTANNMHINVSMFPISNSNNELEHVVCQWIDITEEKNAEEALKKASHEKELLLKEVHHRIKNNMNTLKSLLFIQAEKIKNPEAKEALQAAETRISSMLVLYNQLYKKENIESVSLLNYISELIQILTSTQSSTVEIKQEIEDIEISSKIIFPLGIIVNELITNAIKYAFEEKNESNTITVTTRVIEDECTLTVKDNGKGISLDDTPRGFGLELVDMLTQQLDGTLSITNDQGTKVEITFSLDRISMYA